MYLSDLYYSVTSIKETAVIGREFSAYGMEYAVVGLVNNNDSTKLVLLEYDEHRADDDPCVEPENMTNREIALTDGAMHLGLVDFIKEVEIDGNSFNAGCTHGSLLDSTLDGLYVLAEFMKQGWRSERFFDYPPECLFLHFIELEEGIESLALLDLSQRIRLVAYETLKEEYPQIKLDLDVEKDIDKTVSLFGGEAEICIKRVHLVDLGKEEGIDSLGKEHIAIICPEKMRIPVLEYTVSEDDLCLDIGLSSHLDSLYRDSSNGFATEDGVCCVAIGIQLIGDKKDRKFFTIQQAVKADTKRIELEIVSCSKEIENPTIEEFLI